MYGRQDGWSGRGQESRGRAWEGLKMGAHPGGDEILSPTKRRPSLRGKGMQRNLQRLPRLRQHEAPGDGRRGRACKCHQIVRGRFQRSRVAGRPAPPCPHCTREYTLTSLGVEQYCALSAASWSARPSSLISIGPADG